MAISNYIRREGQEIILYLFIVVLFGFIIPLTAGFSFRGFEESLSSGLINISDYLGTYLIYLFFLIVSLFVIIFPIASLLTIKKAEHPATQQNPTWFRIFTVSYIFNPEDGALAQISKALGFERESNFMRWSKNILRVFIIGILLFGAYGILQTTNPNLNVVGVPSGQPLAQEITVGSDIIFGSAIPSISENGVLLFVLFLLLGVDAYFTSKFIKNKGLALAVFFIIAFLVVCPIVSTGWMTYHGHLYGNSQAKSQATWIFAYGGSALTILFGVFIFFLLFHFFNNLFIKLAEAITLKEDIIFIAAILLGILFLLWVIIEVLLFVRRRKKRLQTEFPD